jgi:hypothetical protein
MRMNIPALHSCLFLVSDDYIGWIRENLIDGSEQDVV